jgi:hypothetical protein
MTVRLSTTVRNIEKIVSNHYLGRIKYFFRWLYNYDAERFDDLQFSDWETLDFVRIK